MNAEEINPNAVTHDAHERQLGTQMTLDICLCEFIFNFSLADPIVIENGSFSWDPETPILRNINIRVKEGTLVGMNF